MGNRSEIVQLPSGTSVPLGAFMARIIRIEQQSETVVYGGGGGGKIREKRAWFSDRYEVRGDIKPIQIGSYTQHKQRIWYTDGRQQTYFEMAGDPPAGLEGHTIVMAVADGGSVVGAYNLDSNETIVWGPFVPPPTTIGKVIKRAAIGVAVVGLVLGFMMKETTWTWVMLFPIGLACLWAYSEIQGIQRAERDDKALEEAVTQLLIDAADGRLGRKSDLSLAGSPAGTARLR